MTRALQVLVLWLLTAGASQCQDAGDPGFTDEPPPPAEPEMSEELAVLVSRYRGEGAESEEARQEALVEIGELDTGETVRWLAALLEEFKGVEQFDIVGALGESRREEAYDALYHLAAQGGYHTARARALSLLSRFTDQDPEQLLKGYAAVKGASLPPVGARGLADLLNRVHADKERAKRLLDILLDLAENAPMGATRAAATEGVDPHISAEAQEHFGITVAEWLETLRQRLTTEEDGDVIGGILTVLGRHGESSDHARTVMLCAHEDPKVRVSALKALNAYAEYQGTARDAKKRERKRLALQLTATDDADPLVREAGFIGLRGSSDTSVLKKATQAVLEDETPSVRLAAGELLAWSESPRASSALFEALKIALQPPADEPAKTRKDWEELAVSLAGHLAASSDEAAIQKLCRHAEKATDVWPRIAAIKALGRAASPRADAALLAAIGDREPRVALAAIEAVGSAATPGAAARLVEVAQRHKEKEIVLACIRALGDTAKGDELAAAYLVANLESGVMELVLTAIDACGRAQVLSALPALKGHLQSQAWQVRSASVAALRRLRLKECIPPLLGRLPREEGKVAAEIVLALRAISGKDLGSDPDLWQSWWDVVSVDFRVPSLEELASREDRTTAGDTYYGIPVVSKRLTFVLDISCSMSAPARVKEGASTRLEVAQEELVAVITKLGADTQFNLIFFDHSVQAWQRQLTRATRKHRAAAEKIVLRQTPRGGTNIYDAVEKAFDDTTVDTIYLLSDGHPGAGKFIDPPRIRREIAKMNQLRRITIHCISVGSSNDLLKHLAEDSSGVYVER